MRSSLDPETDIDVSRATHWLIASAVVVFVCGILAIVLPLTFSLGVAGLLGWLFIFAAVAHLVFGFHLASGTLAWHAFIAAFYALAAINLLVNPLLGVVLLALVIGVVLVAETRCRAQVSSRLRRSIHHRDVKATLECCGPAAPEACRRRVERSSLRAMKADTLGQLIMTGVPGKELDAETARLFRRVQPGAYILFGRNL